MKKIRALICRFLPCLSLVLIIGMFSEIYAAKDVVVIKIKHRWAGELAPIVQSILSPDGSVTVSERANSLVIYDSQVAIQRVRAFLDKYDKPLEQIRIRVRFYESRAGGEGSVAARGRISGDDWQVATGGRTKDGADLSVKGDQGERTDFSGYSVITTAGQAAYIIAGKEIPYNERWPKYSRRYRTGSDSVKFQVVETGFEVTPIISGDNVLLKIVPRMAHDDNEDGIVRFYGAQTEVTVPFGRWIEIGGVDSQKNEVIKEILSRGRNDRTTSMSMLLMAEKL